MTWKLPAIPLKVIACTSDTPFPENVSRKNCIYYLFFSEGKVTSLAILEVLNAFRIFLSLPSGTASLARVAGYITSFVAIFHKCISFCQLGSNFKQIILKQIKQINILLILFFFSFKSLWLPAKRNVLKWFLVASMSLNGLTRGLKTDPN